MRTATAHIATVDTPSFASVPSLSNCGTDKSNLSLYVSSKIATKKNVNQMLKVKFYEDLIRLCTTRLNFTTLVVIASNLEGEISIVPVEQIRSE